MYNFASINLMMQNYSNILDKIYVSFLFCYSALCNMWLDIISTVLFNTKIIYINISEFSSLIKCTSGQYFVMLINLKNR